jgi:hypothetical protein
MVSPPATSEAGTHAAGDTKSEHFEPARVRKLNEKKFSTYCRRLLFQSCCEDSRSQSTNECFLCDLIIFIVQWIMIHVVAFISILAKSHLIVE